MGGHIPGPGFTVTDVAQQVGPDRPVNVIDVATQLSTQWTLEKWAEYVEASASEEGADDDGALGQARGKVYNVISLEIGGTDLAKRVKPPAIVRSVLSIQRDDGKTDVQGRLTGSTTFGTLAALERRTTRTRVRKNRVKSRNESLSGLKYSCTVWYVHGGPEHNAEFQMGMRGSWTVRCSA